MNVKWEEAMRRRYKESLWAGNEATWWVLDPMRQLQFFGDARAEAEAALDEVVAYKAELAAYKSELARVSQMALDNEAKLLAVRETLAGVIDERNEAQAEVARLRDELAVMEAKYRETLRRYDGDL